MAYTLSALKVRSYFCYLRSIRMYPAGPFVEIKGKLDHFIQAQYNSGYISSYSGIIPQFPDIS